MGDLFAEFQKGAAKLDASDKDDTTDSGKLDYTASFMVDNVS